jgi:4-hydroxy-2-oxoheptanedioate aldolase
MRFSRIKAKLSRGEPALIVTCHFTDSSVYEMVSMMGFDGIWMDLEHHATSTETAAALMRAARVGTADIVVRPAKGEYMRMGRLLEAGAQAIMYPRCETADEAAEVVRWAKFAPQGQRGIDGANPDAPYCFMPLGDYIKLANEHTLLVVQVESPGALENADAIARVPGVDVLMLGPADLSVLAGVPFDYKHPLIEGAYRRVAAAAASAGKWWGTTSPSPEHTQMLLGLGAKFICHGADIFMVKQGFERIQALYAPLGFGFENRLAAEVAALEQKR